MNKVAVVDPKTVAKIEKLWKQGLARSVIAERLSMSPSTVSHILQKIRKPDEPMRLR
jgi:Mn-dependent DtxR family transcriptional regulator